jgi:hypothetical protein
MWPHFSLPRHLSSDIFLTLNGTVKVGDLGLGRELSDNTLEAHSKVVSCSHSCLKVLEAFRLPVRGSRVVGEWVVIAVFTFGALIVD